MFAIDYTNTDVQNIHFIRFHGMSSC